MLQSMRWCLDLSGCYNCIQHSWWDTYFLRILFISAADFYKIAQKLIMQLKNRSLSQVQLWNPDSTWCFKIIGFIHYESTQWMCRTKKNRKKHSRCITKSVRSQGCANNTYRRISSYTVDILDKGIDVCTLIVRKLTSAPFNKTKENFIAFFI